MKNLHSFLHTVARMPVRSQAVCALLVVSENFEKTEQFPKIFSAEKLTPYQFTSFQSLQTQLKQHTLQQFETLKPHPLICLIHTSDFTKHSFDELSPLVYKLK